MAQVDFYRLSRDPVERVVPQLAAKVIDGGGRVLVVSGDPAQRLALSEALWAREGAFLAHGEPDGPHAERQPVLLSDGCEAANGARTAILADGEWREEATGFDRAFLLFDDSRIDDARAIWRKLAAQDAVETRFWKQDSRGRWSEGP